MTKKIFITLIISLFNVLFLKAAEIDYTNNSFSYHLEKSEINEDVLLFVSPDDNFILKIYLDELQLDESFYELGQKSTTRSVHTNRLILDTAKINKQDFDLLHVNVSFSRALNTEYLEKLGLESKFFASVINKSHVYDLRQRAKLSPNKVKKASINSFEKNEYIRVKSKHDGLARINADEVLSLYPEWQGRDLAYFHLQNKENELALFIISDDNILNSNDEILYHSSHLYGDSTHYFHYSDENVYFLYYDESNEAPRITLNQNYTFDKKADFVEISSHWEEDTEYYLGAEPGNSFTEYNEGWYWGLDISPTLNPKYASVYRDIYPLEGEKVDLAFELITTKDTIIKDGKKVIPDYRTQFSINYQDVANRNYYSRLRDNVKVESIQSKITQGFNAFTVELLELEVDNQEKMYLDFLEIQYKSKAIANNGRLYFSIPAEINADFVEFQGLNSEKSYILNLQTNEIASQNGIKESFIAASSSKKNISIRLADTLIISDKLGYHLAFKDSQNNHFFTDNPDEFIQKLNELSNQEELAIAINIEMSLKVKNYLNDEFNSQIENNEHFFSAAIVKNNDQFAESFDETISSVLLIQENSSASNYKCKLPLMGSADYLVISESNIEEAKLEKNVYDDLKNTQNQADALIITHKDFLEGANKLAKHRKEFQNLDCKVVLADNIYDIFNYGIKDPKAIKEFGIYAYENWEKKPVHMLLIGDASWDVRQIRTKSITKDFLPSYGLPVADHWIADIDDDGYTDYFVGRIPANTPKQIDDVVNKLIHYDTIPYNSRHKRKLFVSGGENEYMISRFKDKVYQTLRLWLDTDLCIDTVVVSKKDNEVIGETGSGTIREELNQGILWLTYVGHAAAGVFDLDGWEVETLNNFYRNPILTTLACNSGAFSEAELQCRNESYLMEAEKGFVASAGPTGTSELNTDYKLYLYGIGALNNDNVRELGPWLHAGKQYMAIGSKWETFVTYQYTLLGDPMMRVKIDTVSDAYFDQFNLTILNEENETQFIDEDSLVIVNGNLLNSGIKIKENFDLILIHEYEDEIRRDTLNYSELCFFTSFKFEVPIKDKIGLHKVKLVIDYDQVLENEKHENNEYDFSFNVFTSGLMSFDPKDYWIVDADNPEFRLLNPLKNQYDYEYEFSISELKDTNVSIINDIIGRYLTDDIDFIEWKPSIQLEENKSYWLRARMRNLQKDELSEWIWIPFTAEYGADYNFSNWNIFSSDQFANNKLENLKNEDDQISLDKDELNFKVESAAGIRNPDTGVYDVIRWAQIEINGTPYLDNPFYSRGINLVKFNIYTGKARYLNFDTYGNDSQYPDLRDDSTSIKLVHFLRDSVKEDEYLFLAELGNGHRLPEEFFPAPSIGSIDTIKAVLQELYGAKEMNKFNFRQSYILVSRKNNYDEVFFEKIDTTRNKISIEDKLYRYDISGTLTTKTIGPSIKWLKLKTQAQIEAESMIKYKLRFFDELGNSVDTLIDKYSSELDLKSLAMDGYPYLEVEVQLQNEQPEKELILNALSCEFIPAPELILKAEESGLSNNTILRGDTVTLKYKFRNISKRAVVDSINTKVFVQSSLGLLDYKESKMNHIHADTYYQDSVKLVSLTYDQNNEVNINLNPDYVFEENLANNNHTFTLGVREDTTKPLLILYERDRQLYDRYYIAEKTELKLEIWDSSPLKLESGKDIKVRVNGYVKNADSDEKFELKLSPDPDKNSLKAELVFDPGVLDYGPNHFFIIASDATGNADTLDYELNVALNGNISDLQYGPNPSNQEVKITFDYIANNYDGSAEISIFDALGNFVRKLKEDARIGLNQIIWDGKDQRGNTVSTGAYYFELRIISPYYVEPKHGKMIRLSND